MTILNFGNSISLKNFIYKFTASAFDNIAWKLEGTALTFWVPLYSHDFVGYTVVV